MIPCKDCLVKPICHTRIKKGIRQLSSRCSLIHKWLGTDRYGNITIPKIEQLYKELSIVYRKLMK